MGNRRGIYRKANAALTGIPSPSLPMETSWRVRRLGPEGCAQIRGIMPPPRAMAVFIAEPARSAAMTFAITSEVVLKVEVRLVWALILAMIPLLIVFRLRPTTRQRVADWPRTGAHWMVLCAAIEAGPSVAITDETSAGLYWISNWRPAGCAPLLLAALSSRVTNPVGVNDVALLMENVIVDRRSRQ